MKKPLSNEEIIRVAGWFTSGRVHWRLVCAALERACNEVESRNGMKGLSLFLSHLPR
jgi:hypothetical protein